MQKLLIKQIWHFICLLLLVLCLTIFILIDDTLLVGELFGIHTEGWFCLAILTPILHQFYVLIIWRLELYYSSISKLLGDKGFLTFKLGFAILFISRLITVLLVAFSSSDTLSINPKVAYLIAIVFLIPSLYLFYSVKTYFGFDRAFGIDHFYPDVLRDKPFVKKGIFKFTDNGMYVFGFLLLWVPGFILFSKAALVVALFNHLYIWVHYYFTELPDIKVIYGDSK